MCYILLYSSCRPCRHVCSCLFSEMISQSEPNGWHDDHGPTNVGAMVKLDGEGPVDNRPSPKNHPQALCKKKKKIACDTWHVTHDTWHMTCDTLWGVDILSKFQLPSSYGLWFMISWRLGGKGWPTELMNHGGDCRTAPVTPGLLIINIINYWYTAGFVEQLWLPQGLLKYINFSYLYFAAMNFYKRKNIPTLHKS